MMAEVAQNLSVLAEQNHPQVAELATHVEDTAASQVILTNSLSLSASPAQAEDWNHALGGATKVLDQAAHALGVPAVPEELSGSIQKLKQDGLISEEESNKIYSFDNRADVREELEKLTSSGQFPMAELIKLDTAVSQKYPDVYAAQGANLQVAELKNYQTLTHPSEEVLNEIKKWQKNQNVSPSNDIKPYLWYNRAQDLAKEVNLSNFSPDQQSKLVELYPRPVIENPTYSPPPSHVPSSAPTVSPSPVPANSDPASSPAPSPTPPAAKPYLKDAEGPLPGQPTYFIKQLGEGFNLAFTFDPADRARFRMEEAERRLVEAEALSSDPKKSAFYETALKNYQSA